MDTPVFLYGNDNIQFANKTKEDIKATIEFLYKRGMWSKFHYEMWSKALEDMKDAEKLHLWWDAITSGAMFEIESPLEDLIEDMYEGEGGDRKVSPEQMKQARLNFLNAMKLNF